MKPITSAIKRFDPFISERNPLTTFILYGILICAVITSLFALYVFLVEFMRFQFVEIDRLLYSNQNIVSTSDWLTYKYGKGLALAFALPIIVGACDYRIIRGYRDGMYWMVILTMALMLPSLAFELEMVICFNFFTLIPMLVYWAFLFLPRKGKTYWGLCKKAPSWLRVTTVFALIFWIEILLSALKVFGECGRSFSIIA